MMDQGHKEGLGPKFTSYVNAKFNQGLLIHASTKEPVKIMIKHHLSQKQPLLLDHYLVVAEQGTSVELILDYTSDKDAIYQHYGNLKIVAKHGAEVRVTKIQRINNQSLSFDQVTTTVGEGARVTMNDIQLGADLKAIANVQSINGMRGDASTNSIYYGQVDSKSDLSYTMKHIGKKTTSAILSKGSLQKNSHKVFRGNLVFEKGSTGSVGKEEEFVMLLNEKLKSDSIPGLFCKEDDVIGEHAASVGQVDKNKLFYLMSRGFSEAEARKLMIRSAYEEVLVKMKIGEVSEVVSQEINERIS
jgi:Fe-S cluster assembly scaffold protein SufB